MKRYSLLIAALLSFLLVIVLVVAVEYKPFHPTLKQQLFEAKAHVRRLYSEASDVKYGITVLSMHNSTPKSENLIEHERKLAIIEAKIEKAQSEVKRLEDLIASGEQ